MYSKLLNVCNVPWLDRFASLAPRFDIHTIRKRTQSRLSSLIKFVPRFNEQAMIVTLKMTSEFDRDMFDEETVCLQKILNTISCSK